MCAALGIPLVDGSIRTGALPPRRRTAQRMSMLWARRVVSNSRAGLRAWGIDGEKGRVVYNAFDPMRLAALSFSRSPNDRLLPVIMTGRMVPEKDYRTFLQGARLARSRGSKPWRFLAVGDGPDKAALVAENRDLTDDGTLSFPEPTLEVIELVAGSGVGVLMTNASMHAEGCSNSILEYMACGLPVVCSDGGGNRELVADGEAGFVIPSGDPASLADRLLWLTENPAESFRMGQRGQQLVNAKFLPGEMVRKTLGVYCEVLRSRP
jgi:glycosyltransferase involved in cell wall biosynthesis